LRRHPELPVRVFVVWQPILPTDWAPPTTFVMNRIPDRRARQYWDPDHVVVDVTGATRNCAQCARSERNAERGPRISQTFRGITFALPEACYVSPVAR
jgi:hypothetical protein